VRFLPRRPLPEFEPQEGDVPIVKRTIGAFVGTDLTESLRERGIETVIMDRL